MSLALWPNTVIPAPSVSFAGGLATATIRTQMDSGRTRQRSRFTRQTRTYSVAWKLTDFEYGILQSFVFYKITNGADSFQIDLPVGAGDGMQTVTAKILDGTYNATYDDVMYWAVSCKMEVEVVALFTEAELDAYIAAGGIIILPRTQAFTVALSAGDIGKVIAFPATFGAFGPPPGLKIQLVVPAGGFDFGCDLVAGTLTKDGFTASFGAAVPDVGYSLSIIASFTV